MYKFKGNAGGSRTAVGYVKKYVPADGVAADETAGIFYYEKAKERAMEKLDRLYEKALAGAGADGAQIFMAQKMLLEDEGFDQRIRDLILTQHLSFLQAVEKVCNDTALTLINSGDELIAARADDIFSLRNMLTGTGALEVSLCAENTVFCAETLTAADVMELDTANITAIACEKGSSLSHAAILAADMGIAAVMGVGSGFLDAVKDGMRIAVDEASGEVIVDIDEETAAALTAGSHSDAVRKYKESGIRIFANIDRAEDAARAAEYGSEGIGLFRSEYLYLGRTSAPSEEEQFAEYRKAAEAVAPKELMIRTADLGGDKLPEYLEDTGLRGLAFSLNEEQLFKTQLRALYRAAECGNIKLMFPMVNTVTELSKALKLCEEVRLELKCKTDVPVGAMIETLEAVENCAELAKAADFFSIGTNDLYHEMSGAAGRDKEIVEDQSVRETVADMIEKTVKTAHEKGREVTVCGRMAENAMMAERFAGIGVDAVSLPLALIKEKA